MAILTSNIGNLSGKVGNLVFRIRGGKTIVAKAPGKRKTSNDPLRKIREGKFGAAGKIASVINSNPDMQDIWKKSYKTKNSVFTKIFKSIYQQLNGKDFNKFASLMPGHGFMVKGQVLTGMNHIFVEANAIGEFSGIQENEMYIQAVGIIVFSDPIDNTYPETKVSEIASWPPEELKENESQLFCFILNGEQQEEMRVYRKKEYHFHLVTRDDTGEISRFSEPIL